MYNDKRATELARLNFEDVLWLFYGSIIIANIWGNYYEKQHVQTQDKSASIKANSIFEIVLILTFFIYIYLFIRNYNNYNKASPNQKNTYLIRVIGSVFLIIGIICFIYYQDEQRRNP